MLKVLTHISLFFFILLMFDSCGKDSGSNPKNNNTSSANIQEVLLTSPKTISIYENQASATTLFARSQKNITYSISEGDSKDFDLNAKSGVVLFKVAPDYENKKSYTFKAKATDNEGNNDVENIIINILDINEDKVSTSNIKRIFFITTVSPDEGNAAGTPNTPDRPLPTPVAPTPQPIPGDPEPELEEEEEEEEEVYKTYIRDHVNNVVMDNTTNMMWQDDSAARTLKMNWSQANMYCEYLTLGRYSDWRLPGVVELHSIVDNKKSNKATSTVFRNLIARNYWLSTKYFPDSENAWTINLYHGNSYGSFKSSKYYVTCVRDYQ